MTRYFFNSSLKVTQLPLDQSLQRDIFTLIFFLHLARNWHVFEWQTDISCIFNFLGLIERYSNSLLMMMMMMVFFSELLVLSKRVGRLMSRNAALQGWKSFSLHSLQVNYHLVSAWDSPAMYCILFYFKFNCQQESCLIWLFVFLVFISRVGTQTFKLLKSNTQEVLLLIRNLRTWLQGPVVVYSC